MVAQSCHFLNKAYVYKSSVLTEVTCIRAWSRMLHTLFCEDWRLLAFVSGSRMQLLSSLHEHWRPTLRLTLHSSLWSMNVLLAFVSPIFCILDSVSLGLLWSPRAQFTPVLYLQVVNSGFYDVSWQVVVEVWQVARVHYPGLESHPEHNIAKLQMSGFGGVVSFEVCI